MEISIITANKARDNVKNYQIIYDSLFRFKI